MKQKHLLIALAVVLVAGVVYLGTSSSVLQGKFSPRPSTISLCETDTLVFSGATDTVEDFINLANTMSEGVSCPYNITGLNEQFDHRVSFECEASDLVVTADSSLPLHSISCIQDFGDVSKEIRVAIDESGYSETDPASDWLHGMFEDERDGMHESLVLEPQYISITREAK